MNFGRFSLAAQKCFNFYFFQLNSVSILFFLISNSIDYGFCKENQILYFSSIVSATLVCMNFKMAAVLCGTETEQMN